MLAKYGETHTPVSDGQHVQSEVPSSVLTLATPVAAAGHNTSGVVQSYGYPAVAAAVTSTQAGTLTLQRYLDRAGTIPIGTPVTFTLTANVSGYVAVNDGLIFQSFTIDVSNTGGSPAALSNVLVLLGSAS